MFFDNFSLKSHVVMVQEINYWVAATEADSGWIACYLLSGSEVSPLTPKSAKNQIQENSQILFCQILKNNWCHAKEPPKRFHLNGLTIGFRPQTQKVIELDCRLHIFISDSCWEWKQGLHDSQFCQNAKQRNINKQHHRNILLNSPAFILMMTTCTIWGLCSHSWLLKFDWHE